MKIKKGDIIQYEENFIARIIETGTTSHKAEIIKLLKNGWYGKDVGHRLQTAYNTEIEEGTCWIITPKFENSNESIKAKNGKTVTCLLTKTSK